MLVVGHLGWSAHWQMGPAASFHAHPLLAACLRPPWLQVMEALTGQWRPNIDRTANRKHIQLVPLESNSPHACPDVWGPNNVGVRATARQECCRLARTPDGMVTLPD